MRDFALFLAICLIVLVIYTGTNRPLPPDALEVEKLNITAVYPHDGSRLSEAAESGLLVVDLSKPAIVEIYVDDQFTEAVNATTSIYGLYLVNYKYWYRGCEVLRWSLEHNMSYGWHKVTFVAKHGDEIARKTVWWFNDLATQDNIKACESLWKKI